MHLFPKDLHEIKDVVPVFHLFLGRMEESSTKQQLEAKYLLEDTYLIPNTIRGF